MKSLRCAMVAVLFAAACGGGGDGGERTTPTTPTPPATPANRAPVIDAMAITPQYGIAQLTLFTMTSSASDADGDSLGYTWDLGDGTQVSGTGATRTYQAPGDRTVRLTVTDGKGGSVSATRQLVVGGMTGRWTGTLDVTSCTGRVKPMSATLTQNLTRVTGSFTFPEGICRYGSGTAVTDPAEPGSFDIHGSLRVRIKIPPYIDAYLRGTLDSSGRRVTGGLYGSGHQGTPVILNRQ